MVHRLARVLSNLWLPPRNLSGRHRAGSGEVYVLCRDGRPPVRHLDSE